LILLLSTIIIITITNTNSITNMVYIYSTIQSIFAILQEENKKNIVYTDEFNIPVSNNYYSLIIDPNDEDYKLALSSICRTDFIESREPGGVISTGLIEEEQIYDINIINKNIKDVGVLIDLVLQSVKESSSTLHLIIDIDFLLTLFKQFYDIGCEIHVIDFIIYKFKNMVDAIYIYSKNNMINAKSILYKQITECLKDVHINKSISDNNIYTLYKNINNTYWYLDIKDDEDSDTPNISIDVNISDVISNIFNGEDELYVLNPCDKNKLFL
jgi:hypothetical protein